MPKNKLTKRNYLGVGYVHIFSNNLTGDEVVVECTQQEYEALGIPNPTNPTLPGHTWKYSAGGTIKVDSPTTILGENEYCEFDGGYAMISKDNGGDFRLDKLPVEAIVDDILVEVLPVDPII